MGERRQTDQDQFSTCISSFIESVYKSESSNPFRKADTRDLVVKGVNLPPPSLHSLLYGMFLLDKVPVVRSGGDLISH